MDKNIVMNNSIFIVPSWSELLGYPSLGKYVNQDVTKINYDPVVFFGSVECTAKTERGLVHILFGLGYLDLKFEVQAGIDILDKRLLTGLVIPDFVYDYMAKEKDIALTNNQDIIICEDIVKIPVDISPLSDSEINAAKGIIFRNVFVPYKRTFLDLFEAIRNKDNYDIMASGHVLLSAHKEFYDELLVSEMNMKDKLAEYRKGTPGISKFTHNADKLLNAYFSYDEMKEINRILEQVKEVYASITFDENYMFSILEKASNQLSEKIGKVSYLSLNSQKKPIFASSVGFSEEYINWDGKYPRRTKADLPQPK
ncbi:MAG: hypothetical protein GF364_12925, partial [Candidatus Lokiarchaeota archaeon]|nr:hypothetical protein [Candidatus Lokiarchaeota archaeon]